MINKITSNTNFHQPNTKLIFLLFLSIHISKKYRYKQLQGYMNIYSLGSFLMVLLCPKRSLVTILFLLTTDPPKTTFHCSWSWHQLNSVRSSLTELSRPISMVHIAPQLLQLIDRHHQTIAHT